MSRWCKIGWTIFVISFFILIGTRFVLAGWTPILFIPLGLVVGSFMFSALIDMKYYLEFFTMRSTKHGLNMGAMIALFLILITAINALSIRHSLSWDLTEEKVHSLSPSTLDFLKTLKDKKTEVTITVFYLGFEAREAKITAKEVLQRYQAQSPHIRVRYVDAYVHKEKAHKYLKGSNFGNITAFVESSHRGNRDNNNSSKRIQVLTPLLEEKLTPALIKVTRGETKKIYFLVGHGERSISNGDAVGIKSFAQALERVSYEVEELNLFNTKVVPSDASALVVAGPEFPYILSELKSIEKFLKEGGRLMIALDPHQKHQFSRWLLQWGVKFVDNLVISPFVTLTGRGQTVTAGRIYDETHEVTRQMKWNTLTFFDWTSELSKINTMNMINMNNVNVTELIKTDGNAVSVALTPSGGKAKAGSPRQRVIAMAVSGTYSDKNNKNHQREFRLLVFGDSDFLSEKDISLYANMELALNSMAYLAGEEDVLGITPKAWSNTPTKMTSYQMRGLFLGGLALPMILLILAGIVFHKRRNM